MEEVTHDEIIEEPVPRFWEIADLSKSPKYKCPTCSKSIAFHPNYINANVSGCGTCEEIEDICKRMLKYRGYEFVSIEKTKKVYTITFKCPLGHIYKLTWTSLREGRGCTTCKKKEEQKERPSSANIKATREECDCKKLGKGEQFSSSYVCEHYNFAVIWPNSFKYWCFELNKGIDPYRISPSSTQDAYFQCDKCNKPYLRSINRKNQTKGCDCCYGSGVCLENSLHTTHPEIAKLWHPENVTKPWEVTFGSNDEYLWSCDNGNPEHKYERSVKDQTKSSGRCKLCNVRNITIFGGHEEFVRASREIHGDKYDYPDPMIKMDVHININCRATTLTTGKPHGLFLQIPDHHKQGSGCPQCAKERKMSKGAMSIMTILINWEFIEEVHYFTEHPLENMVYIKPLRLDFYIKENMCGNPHPIAIEFDHIQHFEDMKGIWGKCLETQKRDMRKDLFCVQNQINLIRIPYTDKITDEYLATLIKKCRTDKVVYISYRHYEDEIRKFADLEIMIVETVSLPNKYKDIKCSFEMQETVVSISSE